MVYALLGTSGSLAVGPVAITALMTSAALAPLAHGDPARYAALAGLLAVLVGAIQVLMGVLRLGVLVNFMSHSVLSGFTSAAAIVIAASQVKDLFGLDAERAETFPGDRGVGVASPPGPRTASRFASRRPASPGWSWRAGSSRGCPAPCSWSPG